MQNLIFYLTFYEKENRKYAKLEFELCLYIDYYEENTNFSFECDGVFAKNYYEYDIDELWDEDNFDDIVQELSTWENIFKSPFSNSFYDKKVDWNFKPNGVKRISDHWNFYSKGNIHCATNEIIEDGIFQLGIYNSENHNFEINELVVKEEEYIL